MNFEKFEDQNINNKYVTLEKEKIHILKSLFQRQFQNFNIAYYCPYQNEFLLFIIYI